MDAPRPTTADGPLDEDAFKTLLWRLFLHFIDLPSDQFDDAVRGALRQCCTALGVDRSSVWQIQPGDEEDLKLTHNYEASVAGSAVDERTGSIQAGLTRIFPLKGGRAYPAASGARANFPWFLSRVRAGLTTVASALDDLPGDAAVDVKTLRRVGTVSTAIVPLRTDAGVLGCVTFASTTTPRRWTEALVQRLELIGQVLARALNAKRTPRLLRESEAINRATFEQAAVGIAHVAPDGAWLRVNDKLCDILGYRRGELVGGMTFQDLTHPDDLKSDLDMVRELLTGRRATYSTEKRYIRRNASIVWANLTVSLVRDADGQPKHFIQAPTVPWHGNCYYGPA
jgi:PAS domain S-box-containing protein